MMLGIFLMSLSGDFAASAAFRTRFATHRYHWGAIRQKNDVHRLIDANTLTKRDYV